MKGDDEILPISTMIVKTNLFDTKGVAQDTQTQLIPNDVGLYEGEGRLIMTPTKQLTINGKTYITFDIRYDYKKMKQGIVFDKAFEYYFEPHHFNAYYNADDSLFILRVKKEAATGFLKGLSKIKFGTAKKSHYSFTELSVDFKEIMAKAENVSGLTARVDRDHIHAQAYWGDNVDQDAEVTHIIAQDKTSYVQLQINLETGQIVKVGITKHGNIVLYTIPKTEESQIALTLQIYSQFLI